MKISRGKNKPFHYQPRFLKENKKDKSSKENDFISQWKLTNKSNRKIKGVLSIRTLILLLVLLLISVYLLNSYIE